MGSKSTRQPIDYYRKRYEDLRSVAEYHSSLQSPRTIRDLLDLRRSLGWLISIAERRAVSGLVGKTGSTGLILDIPCGGGKLNPLWNGRNRVVGIDSSRPMLDQFLANGGHEALQGDIGHIPVRNATAEVVIC